jgi:hypothetical protein
MIFEKKSERADSRGIERTMVSTGGPISCVVLRGRDPFFRGPARGNNTARRQWWQLKVADRFQMWAGVDLESTNL